MKKLNKKQKIIIFLVAFLIITPLIVLYILNENGVFDTRSSASGVLSEELAKADLNGDDKITISDFSIWLSTYRAFKENNVAGYATMGDLDGDGSIKISDFTTWLTLWRKYKNLNNEVTCNTLWWFDNSTRVCGQRKFCGAYMYLGLQTFKTEAECKDALSAELPEENRFGTGVDGVCTVSGDLNINTGSCTSSREYGDAVSFSVTTNVASGSTSITLAADPKGLAAKDEILIIDLKGTSSNNSNVGKFETAVIKSISGRVLTLNSGISNSYDGTTQKIMVQRVPQYTNVTVNDGAKFYPSAWNGATGGVLMFRATGTVTVKGLIHANGLGYKGGAAPTTDSGGGVGGESFAGTGGDGGANNRSGVAATCGGGGGSGGTGSTGGNGTSNLGGAGGGGGGGQGNAKYGAGGGGAGGGYGGIGLKGYGATNDAISGSQNASGKGGSGHSYPAVTECENGTLKTGACVDGADPVTINISSGGAGGGGGSYGVADLSKLYFGSGGGAGGRGAYYGNSGGKGGNGGGIIYISAKTITVTGVISSSGQAGEGGGNNIGGSGGGGAGGSVKLVVDTATLGTSLVRASAGKNGGGTMYGGDGGVGRIRIEYIISITGTTSPTASSEKKN